jgi:hypothetical protein
VSDNGSPLFAKSKGEKMVRFHLQLNFCSSNMISQFFICYSQYLSLCVNQCRDSFSHFILNFRSSKPQFVNPQFALSINKRFDQPFCSSLLQKTCETPTSREVKQVEISKNVVRNGNI